MERKQFTFYRSYYEAVSELPKKEQANVILAICGYALDEKEPYLTEKSQNAFERVRKQIDTERRQSAEGRNCFEYKEWRKSVFNRDNFTCQICGKRGVHLNAHHIKEYAYFPELRYSIDNGITLCENCHHSVHNEKKRRRIIE